MATWLKTHAGPLSPKRTEYALTHGCTVARAHHPNPSNHLLHVSARSAVQHQHQGGGGGGGDAAVVLHWCIVLTMARSFTDSTEQPPGQARIRKREHVLIVCSRVHTIRTARLTACSADDELSGPVASSSAARRWNQSRFLDSFGLGVVSADRPRCAHMDIVPFDCSHNNVTYSYSTTSLRCALPETRSHAIYSTQSTFQMCVLACWSVSRTA